MIKHKVKSPVAMYLTNLFTWYMSIKQFVSFDIETTDTDPKVGDIFAYVVTDRHGNSEVYRMDTEDEVQNRIGWKKLRRLFADGKTAIICHNYKFEHSFLEKHNIYIHPKTPWHDTVLMSRMLRNLWPSHALDYAPYILCNYTRKWDQLVKEQSEARGGRYDRVDKDIMYNYQIADGERTMILFLTWIAEFETNPALYKDYLVEIELVKTTLEMEKFGIKLDFEETNKLIVEIEDKLEALTHEIYDFLGEYANLGSDAVVRRLFYTRFNFPIVKRTKIGRQPAVDKDVIKALRDKGIQNPILDLVQKYRTWSSGLTMIKSYMDKADEDGIIYPTINTCQAKTRRQSGENPNMQNVSKEEKLDNPYTVPARRCFRARVGSLLIFVDYAGIEMRLMIGRSNSQKMIEIMRNGGNVHEVACKIFYQDKFRSKKLDKPMYDAGKNGHFALPYGCTPLKLGRTLKFKNPKVEGPEAFQRYATEFPEIAYLSKTVAEEVREFSYVMLPFGSKLYVPISKAYAGLNYLIQGTAALILKRAEIMISKYFREVWDNRLRLLLPIHDELVIHFPRELLQYRDNILYDISRLMTDIPEINVPLEVEYKSTTSTWDRAKGITFTAAEDWVYDYDNRMEFFSIAA